MSAAPIVLLTLLFGAQPQERVAAIQVHGNVLTTETAILAIAGVSIGDPFEAGTLDQVARRLRDGHGFSSVDVLKRFASIDDPTQIALVILVRENVVMTRNPAAGAAVRHRRGPPLMYAPLLGYEDGYGLTYGVKAAWPDLAGPGTRLAAPFSWGGDKRAGVEFEKTFSGSVLSRAVASAAISRRTHPFFDAADDRRSLRLRVERALGRPLRVGATLGHEAVSFMRAETGMNVAGADLVLDTRIDPLLARQAVFGRASWERLTFSTADPVQRVDLEARGYLGLPLKATLVARVRRQDSDRPLPPFERPLFGGTQTVRGFAVGSAIGDTIVSASAELRVPLTSPLRVGQFGVSAFVDEGAVYDKGERLRDQTFKRGAGGGVWLAATVFRLSAYLAHGVGGSTRLHVETTLLF